MTRKIDPEIGGWYRGEDGQFEVVAWDERSGTVALQYFDGTLTELDIETWDGLARGDLDDAEAAVFPESRNDPLNDLEF